MSLGSPLRLHSFEPCAGLAVEVRWDVEAPQSDDGAPTLRLEFAVEDPDQAILWPEPGPSPGQRDELWRHTCMELFIGLDRAENYCEINVSPGGDWAFYYFDGYRARHPFVGRPAAPQSVRVEGNATRRVVSFELNVRRIHDLIGHPLWRWQPTAVLETAKGSSYWAPSHPGPRPDFHRLEHLPLWDPYQKLDRP